MIYHYCNSNISHSQNLFFIKNHWRGGVLKCLIISVQLKDPRSDDNTFKALATLEIAWMTGSFCKFSLGVLRVNKRDLYISGML